MRLPALPALRPTTRLALALLAGCATSEATPRAATTPDSSAARPVTAAPVSDIPAGLPADSALRMAADLGRIEGTATAKVWLLVVSDFQCPYCRQWHQESHATILRDYVAPGKLRLAYVNFPLPNHVHALAAAEGAMCASAQGKFTPFADAVFAAQAKWEGLTGDAAAATFAGIARETGVDPDAWSRCVTSGAMRPLVLADRERSRQAGVGSTPTFIIGQTVIPGAMPLAQFRKVLDEEIAKAQAAPAR
jgi:protein-disulfide isomerase